MADVIGGNNYIKSEDFSNEDETKACEQILDSFLLNEVEEQELKPTILDTAWEETFNDLDLFPDLGECIY